MRAPGSNVTNAHNMRDGAFAWNSGSTRSVPVKLSDGSCWEGSEALLVMTIVCESCNKKTIRWASELLRQWYAYHAGFTPAHLELFTQVRYAEFARLGLNACCAECLSFSRDRIL